MSHIRRTAILVMGALVLAACGDGTATDEERAALEAELAAERERATLLESEVQTALGQAADLQGQLEELATDDEDFTVIQAVRGNVEPPPPRPPADPDAPRPEPGPEYSEPIGDFAFYVEVLTASGVSDFDYQYEEGCVLNNNFKRGSKMVWRVEVIDMATGLRVMDEDGAVTVSLPHGEDADLRFSQRGGGRVEGAPWMWGGAWNIPPDYPVGTLDFEVVVTHSDGRTASWRLPYEGTQVQIVE
jgi:hypothetical protein